MDGSGRRARLVAAISGPDRASDASAQMQRLCRLVADEMALSGCAVVLMSGNVPLGTVAGAGRHVAAVTELQFELGEGPCLQACASGAPVLLPDLAALPAARWPTFVPAAMAAGVRAEFCLPLSAGPGGIGTIDLCRDQPGMLSDEHLADALVAADIARDAMLSLQEPAESADLRVLLDGVGTDRIVVHQATGVVAAQLDESTVNALARLRAAAFESGRSIYDIALDVVGRRVRFDE
ncbi:MAG: GAF domain-containing protein [Trebonia sp.]